MSDLIVFRDGHPDVEVEWPHHVSTSDAGWVRILEYYEDPGFGDMGISGDREVYAFPSDRVAYVQRKRVESTP